MEDCMARFHAKSGKVEILWVAAILAIPQLVLADAPHIGDVQKLKAITFSMGVGSTERESKRITYTPPPGWYVRSHSVECGRNYGNTFFSVSTLPQHWNCLSEERIDQSYKHFLGLAAQAQNVSLQASLKHEQSRLLNELRMVQSTHHALVLEATVKGEGFWKGGGGIQLVVWAELVYIGTDESWSQMSPHFRPEPRPRPVLTFGVCGSSLP
jgi:hypothetical protein